jgi:hypothetical protein
VAQQISSFSPALDELRLPNGQKVSEAEQGFLYGEIARLVPGFSHNLGRVDAIQKYANHLQAIHDEAGRAAVAAWMAEKRSV